MVRYLSRGKGNVFVGLFCLLQPNNFQENSEILQSIR